MARPSLVGIGAIAANTAGNLTPAIPAHTANDILVARVAIWTPNSGTDAGDIPTPASWTLANSQGGGIDGRHGIFWIRAAGAGTTVTFTRSGNWDTGTDTCYHARVAVIRNCKTSGTPYTISTQGTETSSNAIWLAVTASAERLHMMFMGVHDDISAPSEDGYTVDWATTTLGTQGGNGILYKDIDSGTEGGGNLTSGAPAQGNYAIYQMVLHPQTVTGAVVIGLTLERLVAGAYTRRGAASLALTLDRFVHAWQQHYGAVALPMTLGVVTTGQSVIFGRAAGLSIALSTVTAGNYTRRGVVDAAFAINSQVIGRGSFFAIAQGLGMTVGIVTVGALPLALGVLTEDGTLTLTPLSPEDAQTLAAITGDIQTLTPRAEDTQTLQILTENGLFLDPFHEIEGA